MVVATGARDEPVLTAANTLLEWLSQPSDNPEVLAALLPAEVMRQVFNVTGGRNMALFMKRTMHSPEFGKTRLDLLQKWAGMAKSPAITTAGDASDFLRDCAESLNHGLLFNQDIAVGKTHAHRDIPASDYVTTYHSDRTAWTLHLTVHGSGRYLAGNVIDSQPGDLLLISPKASIHYRRSEMATEWQHYWVLFQPEPSWVALMHWKMCAYGMFRLRPQSPLLLDRFQQLIEEMLELHAASPDANQQLVRNLFEQLLIRAQSAVAEGKQFTTDERVLKACKYIEDHLAEPLRAREIARHCNLSESRLAHLFNENLDQSMRAFHGSLRAQRAKRLLATTNETIANVSAQVGYDDPAQFSKFFRKYLGCSPRQFRDQFSKGLNAVAKAS